MLLLLCVGLLSFVSVLAALDLVWRTEGHGVGWWLVVAFASLPVAVVPMVVRGPRGLYTWLLGKPSVWGEVGDIVELTAFVAAVPVLANLALVVGLACSRALRPGGALRWIRWRQFPTIALLIALPGLAGVAPFTRGVIPLAAAAAAAVVVAVSCFGRRGTPRIEQGGRTAVALLVATSAIAATAGLLLFWSEHLNGLQQASMLPAPPEGWAALSIALSCGIGAAGVGKRPDPRGLVPTVALLPIAAYVFVVFARTPVVPTEGLPILVTLAGTPSGLPTSDAALPPCVVDHRSPPPDCSPRANRIHALPGDTPLDRAPDPPWLVRWPRLHTPPARSLRRFPAAHAGRRLDVVVDIDRDGRARIRDIRPPGLRQAVRPSPVRDPLPIGPELHEAVGALHPLPTTLVLPRTSAWTVQDALSLCVSAAGQGAVGLRLYDPGEDPTGEPFVDPPPGEDERHREPEDGGG